MDKEAGMNAVEAGRSEVFGRYLQDAGYEGDDVPEELVEVSEQFSEIREKFGQISFGMVSEDLGKDTPFPEKHGYFLIGIKVVEAIVDYCELGTLIALDPHSLELYGSRDKVVEVAQVFLEEAAKTMEPSFLIQDCPAVNGLAQEASEILKQAITTSRTAK